MGEFSWAYISGGGISSSGPTGSLQFRVPDAGSNTSISGSSELMWHTASSMLAITGSVEIVGTLTANQYNVNVIDKTVTNISASGDTIFGDTADDTHQFTGSVYVNGPLSAAANISASAFYGDGSTLTGISPAGSDTEVQFNNAGAFGASALARILIVGGEAAALAITGSVIVTGSALNTTTVIDGTHVSSSLNISGSSIYAEDDVHADQFYGDITVPRYVTHDGDSDTYLDFTDDKLTVKVGNKEMLTLTEALTDTFVINSAEAAINTTINSDNGDVLNASTAGIIINDSGMPGHDFRVESNQKQNAIYLDADLQYVHLLADDATPAGGVGTDMALFVSGTIGSKNTAVRGTAVFGGDMVVSGSLYGIDDINVPDDTKINLGDSADALIEYDSGIGRLAISGSATGIELMGGSIGVDYPGGTVVSGTAGGAGSFLALNSSHQVVVATPAGGGGGSPGGSANQIQINDGLGNFAGTTALTWNSPRLAVTGTLDVSGSIEKLGYIQLGVGSGDQDILISALNLQIDPSTGDRDINSINVTPLTTPIFRVEFDDTIRIDESYYTSGSDGIVIAETGDYQLSYNLNYALTTPNSTRACMKTWAIVNFSGSVVSELSGTVMPYTHAYCYLRGDGGTNWGGTSGGNATVKYGTNSVTTIVSASAGDTINVCTSFFGGATSGELDVTILGNQSWLTMEKI